MKVAGAAPTVPETKRKITRSVINQTYAKALTRAESVATAAQQETYAPLLAARSIAALEVAALLTDILAARDKVAEAVNHTTERMAATALEKTTAEALLGTMREMQKSARQKYARSNRIALSDYLVGQHLNGNRANLAQTSQNVYDRTSADTLPGITNTKVKALKTARTAWLNANAAQSTAASAAINSRAELKTMLKSIDDRRIAIQLAADAEWPHANQANAGIRKEFGLPANRPLVV